jgi:hypothetical protein
VVTPIINVILEQGELKFTETYRIKNGVPTTKFANKVVNFHSTLKDGDYTLTISSAKSSKSIQQNKYFHSLVKVFSEETGHTFRECKEFLKREFGTKELLTNPIDKTTRMEVKSVANYNQKEMSELIDRSAQFLQFDMGYTIPIPENT